MATKQATKENTNAVARLIYKAGGHTAPEGYDFSQAHHPQEVAAWNIACAAFRFITGKSLPMVDGDAALKKKFKAAFGG